MKKVIWIFSITNAWTNSTGPIISPANPTITSKKFQEKISAAVQPDIQIEFIGYDENDSSFLDADLIVYFEKDRAFIDQELQKEAVRIPMIDVFDQNYEKITTTIKDALS